MTPIIRAKYSIAELFKKVNFEISISLKYLVFGYKIFDKRIFRF